MAAGDFQPWTVYYKAVADFSDLIREAAKARAELAALTKDIDGMSKGITVNADKAEHGVEDLTRAIRAERGPLLQTADAAQRYNKYVLFGGRDTMDRHLADLQRETNLMGLLNRARQRGFFTPQQDYSMRQREYTQLLLWNRASQQGYQTPEQYLNYLQRQRQAFDQQTRAWRDRDAAMRQALVTAGEYADTLSGLHLTPQQIADANKGIGSINDALTNLPDSVDVKVNIDSVAAQSALDAFQLNLDQTPSLIQSIADFSDAQALTGVSAYKAALSSIPDLVRTRIETDYTGLASTLGHLTPHGLQVPVTYVPAGPLPDQNPRPITELVHERVTGGNDLGFSRQMAAFAVAQQRLRSESLAAAAAEDKLSNSLDGVGAAAAGAAGSGGGGGGGLWAAAAAAAAGGNNARRAWGYWGLLGGRIALFGGAAFIGGWHLAADALIEFAAVAVPAAGRALAGLGAYVAAAFSTYSKAFSQFKSQMIVTGATGFDMPPFAVNQKGQYVNRATKTTRLDFTAAKVAPDVLQQLGMAVQIMQGQTNMIDKLATSTGGVLDRFAGRMVYDFQHSQGALNTFLTVGAKDLAGFGHIAQSFGTLFMNFVKASEITHVAEDLLTVLAAVVKLGAGLTNLIGPWGLAIGIGAHAAYVYGGLLVTGLVKLTGALSTAARWVGNVVPGFSKMADQGYNVAKAMGASDQELAKIASKEPAIKQVASAIGKNAQDVGMLQVQARKAGTSLEEMSRASADGQAAVSKYGKGLSAAGQDAVAMAGYLGKSEKEVATVAEATAKAEQPMSRWAKATGLLTKIPITGWVGGLVIALGAAFFAMSRVTDATQNWIASLNKGLLATPIQQLIPTLTKDMSQVAAAFGKATTAASKMNQAWSGGKQGLTQLTLPIQHAKELGSEYTQLAQTTNLVSNRFSQLGRLAGGGLTQGIGLATQAGIRSQDIMSKNAKTWAIAMIQVKGLIQGYELFGQKAGALGSDINAVTYAQSNQLKQMVALNQAWDTYIQNVGAPRDTFLKLVSDMQSFAQAARATGASMTGLSKPSVVLQQTFQQTYQDANKMLDALRIAGVPGAQFTKVVKEMVASLIPLSGKSRAAHAELSTLVQEAGGPAVHNLKDLTAWAGKPINPLQGMSKASTLATIAMSHLSKQAQLVSQAINNFFTQALAVAELKALGFSKAVGQLAYAQAHYGTTSMQYQRDLQNVNNILHTATQRAQEVANAQNTMGQSVTDVAARIQRTEQARNNLLQELKNAGINSIQAKNDLTKFTDSILTNTQNTDQGKAARQQLIQDLMNAGMHSKEAKQLVDAYTVTIQDNQTATERAQGARQQMITDFQNAGKWGTQAKFDLAAYTIMIEHNQQRTDAGRQARQNLIAELEKAGLSAKQSRALVDQYTGALNKIPGHKHTSISVDGSGSWHVVNSGVTSTGTHRRVHRPTGHAQGGYIDMTQGQQGVDSVPALVMPGEYVIKTSAVQKYGKSTFDALNNMQLANGGLIAAAIAKYASGGVVGSEHGSPPATGKWAIQEDNATVTAIEKQIAADIAAQIKKDEAAAAASSGFAHAGPGGGAPAANAALARRLMPAWANGAEWAAWNALAMAESGWSNIANNASSGAYGIAQALPPTKYPLAGRPPWLGGSSNPTAQITWMIDYIRTRPGYGDPIRAEAHELAFHWYAAGGPVMSDTHPMNTAGGHRGGDRYRNPLRRARLSPGRIDMGVDYSGRGEIMAIGPGVITNTRNSGWPGGTFIGERLTGGTYGGKYVYVAEDVTPKVHRGQRVGTNTVVGILHGGMETGWAAQPGTGETEAARLRQQNMHGDPGAFETAMGLSYSKWLHSLGAPAGRGHGKVHGKIPPGYYGSGQGGGGGGGGGSHHKKRKPLNVPPPGSVKGRPLPGGSVLNLAQRWDQAEKEMVFAYKEELKAMNTVDHARTGHWWTKVKRNRTRKKLVEQAHRDEKHLQEAQNTLNKAYSTISGAGFDGSRLSEQKWDLLGVDISKAWKELHHVPTLRSQTGERWRAARDRLRTFSKATYAAHGAWDKMWGPAGTLVPHRYPRTPGVRIVLPGGKNVPPPDLATLLPLQPVANPSFGISGTPVFAGGGIVPASFGAGAMPAMSAPSMSVAMADGGMVMPASPATRQLSDGAQAVGAGNKSGFNVESITINNPVKETAGGSLTRAVNRMAFMAGRGSN